MEYANVIVDISHEKLDRVFQYRIPEHLKEHLKTGMQVQFPFGNGNRPMKGYVVGFTDTPDYPPERSRNLTESWKAACARNPSSLPWRHG